MPFALPRFIVFVGAVFLLLVTIHVGAGRVRVAAVIQVENSSLCQNKCARKTQELASADPEQVKTMTAAYAEYVKKNGVIEVPDDYDIVIQINKNSKMKN